MEKIIILIPKLQFLKNIRIFALEMTSRRDKTKQQRAQLNSQLEALQPRPRKEHPVAKKMGDFFIDVAKLIIGGVILAGLMKQDINYWILALCGFGAVLMLIGLGLYLVKVSNK